MNLTNKNIWVIPKHIDGYQLQRNILGHIKFLLLAAEGTLLLPFVLSKGGLVHVHRVHNVVNNLKVPLRKLCHGLYNHAFSHSPKSPMFQ